VTEQPRLAKLAKAAYRRDLPHIQRPGATMAITFATHQRWQLPPSARDQTMNIIEAGHRSKFHLHAAVVMPDHVHLLLTPARDSGGQTYGIAEIMSGIKGASAHAVNKALARRGRVWQSESFDRVLRSSERVRAAAEYICENPVRAGLAGSVDEYQWTWREWVEGAG
jgi:putative DNA methylase